MRKVDVTGLTVNQLKARFVAIGEAQDKVLLYNEISEFNQLYDWKVAVLTELKAREGDQRRSLVALLRHPNMQARLNAAYATLAVAPREAREALENIADSDHHPQAADARGALRDLDSGFFKPA